MSGPLAVYEFTDEYGEPLFEKLRWTDPERGKTFSYRGRQPESGKWEPGKPPEADRYLYRLPALLAAIRAGEDVYWPEGEKDADTLTALGFAATSHHQAAAHVTPEQAAWFRGHRAHVFLLLDNDPPGAACVLLRLRLLVTVGLRPAQMTLLYSPYEQDVTDHLDAGHALSALRPVGSMRALQMLAREYRRSGGARWGYGDRP
jgi:hypothetical protein